MLLLSNPSTIQTIEKRAFEGCSKITSIELPSDLTSIGMYAFFNSGLTSVTIPEKVKSIGDLAFTNMRLIRSLCKMPPSIAEITFCKINSYGLVCSTYDILLYVPKGYREVYSKAENWQYFTMIKEDGDVAIDDSFVLSRIQYADGQLVVSETAMISIYTMEGKLIASYPFEVGEACDLSFLCKGIYIVRVRIADKVSNIKIAK